MLAAGRYRLGSVIGRGGMGEVFRATDEQLGRPVAVKVLLPSDRDPCAGERFHREARAAARLNDPHVVSVYDFGHHDDGFFLVMELVEGRTIADELAEHGPLPKDRAIDIVEQAAAGLAAAHRESVVHRDVKPGNLLLAADGTVKVADFGIAQLPGDGAATLTAGGQIIGSAPYLAPERASGGQAGQPSDVYALGCVLYQLVTGQPPFTGEHPAAILYQHVDADPEPPSLLRPELGGQFESVLLSMLAKDPAGRPSASEIATGALRAAPPRTPDRTPVAAPVGAPVGSRLKALLAGGIAVLATTAAVLAGVVLDDSEKRLPPTTDVGPQPIVTSGTPEARPTATRTSTSTTRRTPSGATRSAPASQRVSPSTPAAATTSTEQSPSSAPTRSSTTRTPETPATGPSSSAPPTTSASPTPDRPTSGSPASGTPSPSSQASTTPSASTPAAQD
ncbi:serine/threonine-protein kinase [Kribbella sp. VKM Ac-2566]|uniref:serine/threonine-protein kinase n=1 Tax=Kribbella sp. VKM Ac-2566 TaxID=2512218 RepID=UPI00106381C6|nr:serine/threonine protein kinase [Kribbella sp. VKM Ac-2566]TDW92208.1 serine/threonine-protein kinase [Kribbella sp. VKM Ac-2566]